MMITLVFVVGAAVILGFIYLNTWAENYRNRVAEFHGIPREVARAMFERNPTQFDRDYVIPYRNQQRQANEAPEPVTSHSSLWAISDSFAFFHMRMSAHFEEINTAKADVLRSLERNSYQQYRQSLPAVLTEDEFKDLHHYWKSRAAEDDALAMGVVLLHILGQRLMTKGGRAEVVGAEAWLDVFRYDSLLREFEAKLPGFDPFFIGVFSRLGDLDAELTMGDLLKARKKKPFVGNPKLKDPSKLYYLTHLYA